MVKFTDMKVLAVGNKRSLGLNAGLWVDNGRIDQQRDTKEPCCSSENIDPCHNSSDIKLIIPVNNSAIKYNRSASQSHCLRDPSG